MNAKIRKISYLGNKKTNRYKNNVQLYVNPFFGSNDVLTVTDLKEMKYTSRIKVKAHVKKLSVGKYTYYRVLTSQFSKHTDKYCMLLPVSRSMEHDITKKSSLDKYLLASNDKSKDLLLMIVLNGMFLERVCA